MINYDEIINELDEIGYSEIDNFLSYEEKNQINEFIETKKKLFKSENFSLADGHLDHEVFHKIRQNTFFKELSIKILKKNQINGNLDGIKDFHNVLGVRKPQENQNSTIKFHFDAFLITIIFPIAVPQGDEKNGNLLIFPNMRSLSRISLYNFFIKFITQNNFFRKMINKNFARKLFKMKSFDLDTNKILIFYGYRSFHGVDNLGKNKYRSTLLFHIFNPHKDTLINDLVLKRNKDGLKPL